MRHHTALRRKDPTVPSRPRRKGAQSGHEHRTRPQSPQMAPPGAEPQGLNGPLLDLVPKEHRSGLVYRLRPEGAALSLWLNGGARFVAGFGLDILVG